MNYFGKICDYSDMNNKYYETKLLKKTCEECDVDIEFIVKDFLKKDITINFHPDRISGNGKMVLENLLNDGIYKNQYQTGISNGSTSAFIGGQRYQWENNLFNNIYGEDLSNRPVYGALNIFNNIDGASPRFGSCFITLNSSMVGYSTFSDGDSSAKNKILCHQNNVHILINHLLQEVEANKRFLNKTINYPQEALAFIDNHIFKDMGRNMDFYIEAHVHNKINLLSDVKELYLDEAYRNTDIEKIAHELCSKYDISLRWIPKREMNVYEMNKIFRGKEPINFIERALVDHDLRETVNAFSLGIISNQLNQCIKSEYISQLIKQCWHILAVFG